MEYIFFQLGFAYFFLEINFDTCIWLLPARHEGLPGLTDLRQTGPLTLGIRTKV